jgi:anti-sigma regulatory factor (Ser/Thr protein kinase)
MRYLNKRQVRLGTQWLGRLLQPERSRPQLCVVPARPAVIERSIPTTAHAVDAAVNEVFAAICTAWQVCPEDLADVRLSLHEALHNAYEHGNLEVYGTERAAALERGTYLELLARRERQPQYQGRRIHLQAELTAEQMTITITDEGCGFDHERRLQQARWATRPPISGKGLLLLASLMDRVEFNAAGNAVTLVKQRRASTRRAA